MILVDNAIYSFGLQLSNGIPIIPFKQDKSDEEFLYLQHFLQNVYHLDDLREPLKEIFGFDKISQEYNFDEFIEYYDYEECELEQKEDDKYETELQKMPSHRLINVLPPPTLPSDRASQPQLAKSVIDSLDGIA